CPPDWLVLQVPARVLLEGDMVTLRCRCSGNKSVKDVHFYHDWKYLGRSLDGTELSLSPLRLNDTGSYRCSGWVRNWDSWREESKLVTVTVHGENHHSQD
ncbi:FCGR3 protein, partial [Dasyornis broadbenti]|nr:FCGR3 protein [Dasyornis broadbenti]